MNRDVITQGANPQFFGKQEQSVVKGLTPEIISRTFKDHNLGGQPGQLAAGKLQGAKNPLFGTFSWRNYVNANI